MTTGEPLVVEIERLSWDDWNHAHIARHDVTADEVVEVIAGRPIFRRSPAKNRIVAIGPTASGRVLKIVLGPDLVISGVFYAFTAHPASRKERRIYDGAIHERTLW